ncbi:hypothetical protein [Tepidibacillus fermentans]|uniref:Uncharacterized protein n=1 Tax=Tepidibacillus fermentans TaxID=1281767 RepID=A0A4R3K554_9BACI|nr:hypothetical protein [Tepidibacillus fermentans]TCS77948.1 hypothetical protein EDD72_1324 [Tepidibacillus fermentans]
MTRLEQIHTLLEEDKDALIGSYLSLLAYIDIHQNIADSSKQFILDLAHTVHHHIEVLPKDSLPIFQELKDNEAKRLEELNESQKVGRKNGE